MGCREQAWGCRDSGPGLVGVAGKGSLRTGLVSPQCTSQERGREHPNTGVASPSTCIWEHALDFLQ